MTTQPANIGPQNVLRTCPSNVPRTCLKDPIWQSWGRPDLTSQGRPNLESWGRPELKFWGRPNLTFKRRPWEVNSGPLPQDVLRTSPRRPSEYSNLDIPKIFFNFSFRTNSLDHIYLKAFQHSRCIENAVKLLRWSIFYKIS